MLPRVLGNAAVSAGRTDTFLGERYRRIAHRRGRKKAVVAIGRSILVIISAPARRPRRPLRRPGQQLLRHPHQPRTPQARPHPPVRSPRLQGHPRTRRLTLHAKPARLRRRSAGRCRAPANSPIFGSGVPSPLDHDLVTIVTTQLTGIEAGQWTYRADHSDRAAVCHAVPFRPWACGGELSGAGTCGAPVGLGEARTGTAVVPADLRQSSSNQCHQVGLGVVTQGEQASSARIAR